MHTRDVIDKVQQDEYDSIINENDFVAKSNQLRQMAFEKGIQERNPNAPPYRQKNVLSLSGGGSYGAFSAGVLCGWTARGDRPEFDVVTGISIGALIAPYAFLGSAYDDQMKAFFTTYEARDLFNVKIFRGLFGEAFTDNSRLADKIEEALTMQLVCAIAREHQKGRRLYIGTTAAESRQFIIWDIGAIACKGRPQDRKLIIQILLGSSAVPGVFPPQHIDVQVDGQCVTERHVDGGVSKTLFIHPPYVPPEHRSQNPNADFVGTNLYLIVAGKLYNDLEKIRPMAFNLFGTQVSGVIYAQTRGDLQQTFLFSMLSGMNYFMTAIPPEYPAPTSSLAFDIPSLTGMFNEGYRIASQGKAWRTTPPGTEPGETSNLRAGTDLTYQIRGPISRSDKGPKPFQPNSSSNQFIPGAPLVK